MTDPEHFEQAFSSTTWGYKRVIMAPRAEGQKARAPKALRWWRYSRLNGRKPLQITVTYRGGPECWYEVKARGSVGRFRGSVYLHDVMDEIYGGERRSK